MPYLPRMKGFRQTDTIQDGQHFEVYENTYTKICYPMLQVHRTTCSSFEFSLCMSLIVCFLQFASLHCKDFHYSIKVNFDLLYLHCSKLKVRCQYCTDSNVNFLYLPFLFHLNRMIGHLLDMFVLHKILISAPNRTPNQVLAACTGTTKIFLSLNLANWS